MSEKIKTENGNSLENLHKLLHDRSILAANVAKCGPLREYWSCSLFLVDCSLSTTFFFCSSGSPDMSALTQVVQPQSRLLCVDKINSRSIEKWPRGLVRMKEIDKCPTEENIEFLDVL